MALHKSTNNFEECSFDGRSQDKALRALLANYHETTDAKGRYPYRGLSLLERQSAPRALAARPPEATIRNLRVPADTLWAPIVDRQLHHGIRARLSPGKGEDC